MNIKTELEALESLLITRGCNNPDVHLVISANTQYRGHIGYYPDDDTSHIYKYFYDDTVEFVLSGMRKFIYDIKSLEERRTEEYLKKLAAAVEYGKKIGLDDNFINPLELQMKKLSGNIIEHKPEYSAPQPSRRDLDDEIPV